MPKPGTGPVEAIRLLRTTRASAVKARKAAIQQMHGLLFGAPDELREALAGLNRAALVTRCAPTPPACTTPPSQPRQPCGSWPAGSNSWTTKSHWQMPL